MDYALGVIAGVVMGVVWTFITLNPTDIDNINSACAVNGGIEEAVVDIMSVRVYCKSGAKFTLED